MKLDSNRTIRFSLVVLAAVSMLAVRPHRAFTCACCSDPGEWSEETVEVSQWNLSELNRLRLYRTARLYTTDASPDNMQGLSIAQDEPLDDLRVSLSNSDRRWSLHFKEKGGNAGSLIFYLPKKMIDYRVDLTTNVKRPAREPAGVYHEWRFKGPVHGTGLFASGNAPNTTYHLVLQWNGNECMSAEYVKKWRIQITGPKANYAFYGEFITPRDPSAQGS